MVAIWVVAWVLVNWVLAARQLLGSGSSGAWVVVAWGACVVAAWQLLGSGGSGAWVVPACVVAAVRNHILASGQV